MPPPGGAMRERWEAIAALVGLAEEFAAPGASLPDAGATESAAPESAGGSGRTLAEFGAELARRAAAQHAPTVDGVTLASLHSAKGLEWDAVFLVGLAEGTLPTTYAKTPDQLEEERRLLYVGVTRARQWLWLSYAGSRAPGGRQRRASRFLPGADPAGTTNGQGPGRGRRAAERRSVIVSCRICGTALLTGPERKLGRCSTCPSDLDEELLDRLRTWRTRVASAAKVPAYVVFTDATLTALAERQPVNDAGLIDIAGIGPRKLALYGRSVLAIVAGGTVDAAMTMVDEAQ